MAIVHQLQEIFFNDVPVVDIWYGAHWFQYRTEHAVGWPNEETPYAQQTDPFLVIINLVPPGEESPMNFPTLEEAPAVLAGSLASQLGRRRHAGHGRTGSRSMTIRLAVRGQRSWSTSCARSRSLS